MTGSKPRKDRPSNSRWLGLRGGLGALVLICLATSSVSAQLVVRDPAVTARNAITAMVKDYLLNVQREQHSELRRMATRLSVHTSLNKYVLPDPPRWRTHGGDYLFAGPYNDALIFGDSRGAAYMALTHPLLSAVQGLSRLPADARRALLARLATIELADAAAIAATHDSGQLRLNGRRSELQVIDALETHVINPSNEQSATAVLDKISGAALIGTRQRQARAQLLTGIVEQLLIEGKRARDSEAAAMNMRLVTWRDGRAANEAFVAGSADALRTWRQP
jgi:hypothetical protein